jgi:hypothetical protein
MDVSGLHVCPIFKGQAVQRVSSRVLSHLDIVNGGGMIRFFFFKF